MENERLIPGTVQYHMKIQVQAGPAFLTLSNSIYLYMCVCVPQEEVQRTAPAASSNLCLVASPMSMAWDKEVKSVSPILGFQIFKLQRRFASSSSLRP